MTTAPEPLYPTSETELWFLFDFSIPDAGCKMRRHKYTWKSHASLERLDQHHAVLIVRAGGAGELAR